MPIITRLAQTVTTPITGSESAFDSSGATGGSASVSASSSGGGGADSEAKSCRWSNFGGPVSGLITKIELIYDFSWSTEAHGSVDEDGSADSDASALTSDFSGGSSISIAGPGPVSDDDNDDNSGTIVRSLSTSVDLSTVNLDANIDAFADTSNVLTSSNSAASITISDLRVEITVSPQHSGGFIFGGI